MDKSLKGCLFLTIGIITAVVICAIGLYVYYTIPNQVSFISHPLIKESYSENLTLGDSRISKSALAKHDESIIYQSLLTSDTGFDKTILYRAVYKSNSETKFANDLPISPSDMQGFTMPFGADTVRNEINPLLQIPKKGTVPSGNKLTVYSPLNNLIINTGTGTYNYYYKSIDKEGYVSDLTIYDKSNKLIYYERRRYYAFQ